MANKGSGKSGLDFISALQLLFIALKLMGYIDWPWHWVLAPFLIELALFVGAALVTAIAYMAQK